MGSGGSKNAAAANHSAASSFDGGGRTLRSKRASRAFKSSCFCPSFALDDLPEIKHEKRNACTDEGGNKHSQENDERCRKLNTSPSYIVPSAPSAIHHNNDDSTVQINHGASSTAVGAIRGTFSNASRTSSSPCEMPNGMDNSLTRTLSLQASRACNSAHDGNSTLDDDSVEDIIRNNSRDEQPVVCREHSEGNMQLRQMTSIGRLHDRGVHRMPFSEGLIDTSYVEASSHDHGSQASLRRGFSSLRRTSPSHRRGEVFHDRPSNRSYHMTGLIDAVHNHHPENQQPREANSHLGEHTSFHERRRRVISQVRALQRLGSRFENSSGHERSCILSGQYRTGRCICRGSYRSSNHIDDSSTNASISRIVMLAEALFEVLDEIHQQSVLLTSQTSFSSIGSVPAPKEIVENMPLRNFTKQQGYANEGTSQCYICLLEYEEGDYMRVLPCNHKFHQVCIDKWLKEIHRVCPLCRADVCNYEAKNMGKPS